MILNNTIDNAFVVMASTIVACNSIFIPLSYNIISDKLKPFIDKDFFLLYIKEPTFKNNLVVSLWGIGFFLFPLFIDISKFVEGKDYASLCIFVRRSYVFAAIWSFVAFLITFLQFSYRTYEYAFNTEEIVFEKIKKQIDEYLGDTKS